MSTLHEAAQEFIADYENGDLGDLKHYARALRAALAQQEQEPVASAWIRDGVMVNAFPWPPGDPRGRDEDQYWQRKGYTASPLYTHPPRREWRSLSEEEIEDMSLSNTDSEIRRRQFARAIEAALKEKNNG